MKRVWIGLLGLGVLLAACGPGAAAADDQAAARGQDLYLSGGASGIPCATCHTLDGTDLVGPSFQGIATRAASRLEGVSPQEYLRQSIIQPGSYVVEGYSDAMNKNYAETLSEQDIEDLVAYLMTLE